MKKWLMLGFLLIASKSHASMILNPGPNFGSFSGPTCTAPILVSSTSKYCGNVANCNVTVANVVKGDEIVVGLIANNNVATMRVSDGAQSTYTAHTRISNAAGPTTVHIFTASANATGSIVVYSTMPASVDNGLHVAIFRNIAVPPGDFDTQASGTESGAGTTFNTGNFTTTNANNALFAVLGNESTAITNMAITSTAATLTKMKDELSNTSSSAFGFTTSTQTTKTGTATWTGSSSDGVLILAVLKASCGI